MSSEVDPRRIEACREVARTLGANFPGVMRDAFFDIGMKMVQAYLSASPSIGRVGDRSVDAARHFIGHAVKEVGMLGPKAEAVAVNNIGYYLECATKALVYHEEPAGDTQGALPAGAGTDLAAAFEHQVTQQTNAYEFKTGAKPGTWMFRCSDWIDITAILAALVSPPDNGEPIAALLDAYDAETKKLPLGHEMPTRGASTYNWRRSVVDELRKMAALQSHNEGRDGK